MHGPSARAVEFESRKVYQSAQQPSYTSWVSFFPGEKGQWYLTCEEVTRPKKPLPRCTRQQYYSMSLPAGFDKSQYLMEIVMLESTDGMKTWHEISRQPCRFHHSAGSFAQARTSDGRFLRFAWSCYSLDSSVKPNEILYESCDNGKTWQKMPPFHDAHFMSYPHRLRTLKDGTLVLAVPLDPKWGPGTDRPMRHAKNLNTVCEQQMMLYFSHDQGRNWNGPLPIFAGLNVHETDFVELPSGDLLFINNSIFHNPGRQFVYRDGRRFTPGPLERVQSVPVTLDPWGNGYKIAPPETVCLTEDGILVGAMRPIPGGYFWSDDLGQTWQTLEGIPDKATWEIYQPSMNYIGKGLIACAGHFGADDFVGQTDQFISIHFFRVETQRRSKECRILFNRDFDETRNVYRNAYTLTLLCDGDPLPGRELEFWYTRPGDPSYDQEGIRPLEDRMKAGGKMLRVRTDANGRAQVNIPEMDNVTDRHVHYQIVARFNADGRDAGYKPVQTPQFQFYALSCQDPLLEPGRIH